MKIVRITIYQGTTEVTDVPTGVEVVIREFLDDMTEADDHEVLKDTSGNEYIERRYTAGENEIVMED